MSRIGRSFPARPIIVPYFNRPKAPSTATDSAPATDTAHVSALGKTITDATGGNDEVSVAPSLDAATSGGTSTGTSAQTWSHTVGASGGILLVYMADDGTAFASAVSYGGTAMTRWTASPPTGGPKTDIWYMLNPPVGAATVSVTPNGAGNHVFGAISLLNVNQGGGNQTFGPVGGFTDGGTSGTSADMGKANPPAQAILLWLNRIAPSTDPATLTTDANSVVVESVQTAANGGTGEFFTVAYAAPDAGNELVWNWSATRSYNSFGVVILPSKTGAARKLTHAPSPSDSLGGTDSAGRLVGRSRTAADSAGASDGATVARQLAVLRAAVDNAAATDLATEASRFSRAGADSLGGSDNAITGSIHGGSRAGTDSAPAADVPTRQLALPRTSVDSATATDAAAPNVMRPRTASDSLGATDTPPTTDNFNRSNGALGGSTTSDGKATWTSVAGTLSVQSNAVIATAVSGGRAVAVIPAGADGTFSARFVGLEAVGIVFRVQDANNYYLINASNIDGTGQIEKVIAGSSNSMGTGTFHFSSGDLITVVVSGTSMSLYINGSFQQSWTDSQFSSAGLGAGVYSQNASVPYSIDDFSYTPASIPRTIALPRTGSDTAAATDATTTRRALVRTGSDTAANTDEHTTVTDNYNRADNSSSLGTATTGQSWIVPTGHGTWGTASNKGVQTVNDSGFAGIGQCVAVLDVGTPSVDMSVTMTVSNPFNSGTPSSSDISPGMAFAWSPAGGGSGYVAVKDVLTGIAHIYQMTLGGGLTSLGSVGTGIGGPGTFRVTYDQSTGVINFYEYGGSTPVLTVTAATKYAGTQHGITTSTFNGHTSSATFDDLSIAPLTTGVPRVLRAPRTGTDSAPASDERTVITDNFNRSDRVLDGDNGWVRQGGTWNIVSNQAQMSSLTGGTVDAINMDILRRNIGVSSATVTVTNIRNAVSGLGPSSLLIGYDPAVDDGYLLNFESGGGTTLYIRRINGGSPFQVGLAGTPDPFGSGIGSTFSVSFNAATGVFTVTQDGTVKLSVTDPTPFTTGTWVGIAAGDSSPDRSGEFWDDFSVALGVPVPTRLATHPRTGSDSAPAVDSPIVPVRASKTATDVVGGTDVATRAAQQFARTVGDTAPAIDQKQSITDDFNRPDSGSLGTTSDGKATWVTPVGVDTILSNAAKPTGVGASLLGYSYVETNSPDGTLQATMNSINLAGLLFRYVDDNNYWKYYYVGAGGYQLVKVVGGVSTTVSGDSSFWSSPGTMRVVLDGNSITLSQTGNIDNSLPVTIIDSDLASATKHGIVWFQSGGNIFAGFDNFSWVPLRAGVARQASFARSGSDSAVATDAAVVPLRLAKTGSDAAAATDIAARVLVASHTGSDAAAATDTATRVLRTARTTSDAEAASDVAIRVALFARTTTDVLAGTDVATRAAQQLARTVSDVEAATDSATRAAAQSRTANDAAPATDVATRSSTRARTGADAAAAVDVATRTLAFARTASDTEAATDVASPTVRFARSAADAASATDTAAASKRGVNASDLEAASDVATRSALTFVRTTSDIEHATDVATRSFQSARTTSDVEAAIDTASRALRFARTSSDSEVATDTASRAQPLVRSSSDSAPATDAATRGALHDARTTSDSAPATDAASRAQSGSRSSSDAEGGTDAVVRQAAVARTGSDGASALDVTSRSFSSTRTGTESAPATDFASSAKVITKFVADGATAADTASAAVRLLRTLADSAPTSDSASRLVRVAPRDIEVTLGDPYERITLGDEAFTISFGERYDHVLLGDATVWNAVFGEAVDPVALGDPELGVAVGDRFDPITLGTPGL